MTRKGDAERQSQGLLPMMSATRTNGADQVSRNKKQTKALAKAKNCPKCVLAAFILIGNISIAYAFRYINSCLRMQVTCQFTPLPKRLFLLANLSLSPMLYDLRRALA